MTAAVVIPARYGSTRFPAKILASRTGKPLVQHVVDQARKCKRIGDVIVATDDERIVAALAPFDTHCVMTDPNHPSGTDRIAEVARQIDSDIILNVQGDEPEIDPLTIDLLAIRLADEPPSGFQMYTAATRFLPPADPNDPNLVKVVFSQSHRALYFSRSAIPFKRDAAATDPTYHLHIGIYAYRRETLLQLAGWSPTDFEQSEKLEQLRALEHDIPIGVLLVEHATHGIDTEKQYEEFVKRYNKVV